MVAVSESPFANLGRMNAEEEEEEPEHDLTDSDSDEEVPAPPAPVEENWLGENWERRGGVWKKVKGRMPRVRKWVKPNQHLFFKGDWGICNDNCTCHGKVSDLMNVEEQEGKKGESENKISMGLTFQVAAVKKPLISVKRITEKGNRVCFGPG